MCDCDLGSAQADRRSIFTKSWPQLPEKKAGQLTDDQVQEFFNKGYLLVRDYFDKADLDACRADLAVLVDKLAQELHEAGKIKSLYENEGVDTRLIRINNEFPGANILFMKRQRFTESFQRLWSNERLLNLVEQLIGPDIIGHPVWNIRSKVPNNEATLVPWHQDCAYMDDDALDVLQLTSWIPFVDANETNGTLQVVEGGHRTGRLAKHVCCYRGTWYVQVSEEEMEKSLEVTIKDAVKTICVPYGSMILFSNLLPHQSLPNLSTITRWSVDLRWQDANKKIGFHNIKPGIIFRTKNDHNIKPDWDKFNSYDRAKIELERLGQKALDPFDTLMGGPWMRRMEIVNNNRHTDAYLAAHGQSLSALAST